MEPWQRRHTFLDLQLAKARLRARHAAAAAPKSASGFVTRLARRSVPWYLHHQPEELLVDDFMDEVHDAEGGLLPGMIASPPKWHSAGKAAKYRTRTPLTTPAQSPTVSAVRGLYTAGRAASPPPKPAKSALELDPRAFERPYAATVLAAWWRGVIDRKFVWGKDGVYQATVVVHIQRVFRGHVGRKIARRRREEFVAAAGYAVTRVVRGFLARCLRRKLEYGRNCAAATSIASAVKMLLERKRFHAALDAQRQAAASRLQGFWVIARAKLYTQRLAATIARVQSDVAVAKRLAVGSASVATELEAPCKEVHTALAVAAASRHTSAWVAALLTDAHTPRTCCLCRKVAAPFRTPCRQCKVATVVQNGHRVQVSLRASTAYPVLSDPWFVCRVLAPLSWWTNGQLGAVHSFYKCAGTAPLTLPPSPKAPAGRRRRLSSLQLMAHMMPRTDDSLNMMRVGRRMQSLRDLRRPPQPDADHARPTAVPPHQEWVARWTQEWRWEQSVWQPEAPSEPPTGNPLALQLSFVDWAMVAKAGGMAASSPRPPRQWPLPYQPPPQDAFFPPMSSAAACAPTMHDDVLMPRAFHPSAVRVPHAPAPTADPRMAASLPAVVPESFIGGVALWTAVALHLSNTRRRAAERAYRLALSRRPRDPVIMYGFAMLLQTLPDVSFQEVATLLDAAHALDPDNANFDTVVAPLFEQAARDADGSSALPHVNIAIMAQSRLHALVNTDADLRRRDVRYHAVRASRAYERAVAALAPSHVKAALGTAGGRGLVRGNFGGEGSRPGAPSVMKRVVGRLLEQAALADTAAIITLLNRRRFVTYFLQAPTAAVTARCPPPSPCDGPEAVVVAALRGRLAIMVDASRPPPACVPTVFDMTSSLGLEEPRWQLSPAAASLPGVAAHASGAAALDRLDGNESPDGHWRPLLQAIVSTAAVVRDGGHVSVRHPVVVRRQAFLTRRQQYLAAVAVIQKMQRKRAARALVSQFQCMWKNKRVQTRNLKARLRRRAAHRKALGRRVASVQAAYRGWATRRHLKVRGAAIVVLQQWVRQVLSWKQTLKSRRLKAAVGGPALLSVSTVLKVGVDVSGVSCTVEVTRRGGTYHVAAFSVKDMEWYKLIVTSTDVLQVLARFPWGAPHLLRGPHKPSTRSRTKRRRKITPRDYVHIATMLVHMLTLSDAIPSVSGLSALGGRRALSLEPARLSDSFGHHLDHMDGEYDGTVAAAAGREDRRKELAGAVADARGALPPDLQRRQHALSYDVVMPTVIAPRASRPLRDASNILAVYKK